MTKRTAMSTRSRPASPVGRPAAQYSGTTRPAITSSWIWATSAALWIGAVTARMHGGVGGPPDEHRPGIRVADPRRARPATAAGRGSPSGRPTCISSTVQTAASAWPLASRRVICAGMAGSSSTSAPANSSAVSSCWSAECRSTMTRIGCGSGSAAE